MSFVAGDRIRRRNHKKQKSKKNNHEVLTIKGFDSGMVALEDSNGKTSYMAEKGLDWYEGVLK